jgi:hypothetical protein
MSPKNLLTLHEAIILALINQPARTANFEEIANFIAKRGFYPNRKGNISLVTQVMLRSTKAKGAYAYLFENVGAGYIRLRDSYTGFPLQLWNGLEALLDYDRQFYNPDAKEISVVSGGYDSKETIKLKVSPADVICILSLEKSRKKNVYVEEKGASGKRLVKSYLFNNNKYNFETFCQYLDPCSSYLTRISKNAVVNVAFFDLVKKQLVQYKHPGDKSGILSRIAISGKKDDYNFTRNFEMIQEAHTRRILLQKAALGYKSDIGL